MPVVTRETRFTVGGSTETEVLLISLVATAAPSSDNAHNNARKAAVLNRRRSKEVNQEIEFRVQSVFYNVRLKTGACLFNF